MIENPEITQELAGRSDVQAFRLGEMEVRTTALAELGNGEVHNVLDICSATALDQDPQWVGVQPRPKPLLIDGRCLSVRSYPIRFPKSVRILDIQACNSGYRNLFSYRLKSGPTTRVFLNIGIIALGAVGTSATVLP